MLQVVEPGSLSDLVSLARAALLVTGVVSLPIVGALALVGLVTSILQSSTQVHDPSIGHFPRLIVALLLFAALGSWMGQQITVFTLRAWGVG